MFENTPIHLDDHGFKAAVGTFLYPVICKFFFQARREVAPQLSIQLCTLVRQNSFRSLYALFTTDGIFRLTLC